MVKKSGSGGRAAATRGAAKTLRGKTGIASRRVGTLTQKAVVPKLRSVSTRSVVAKETPSSLASLLAERVAAAR